MTLALSIFPHPLLAGPVRAPDSRNQVIVYQTPCVPTDGSLIASDNEDCWGEEEPARWWIPLPARRPSARLSHRKKVIAGVVAIRSPKGAGDGAAMLVAGRTATSTIGHPHESWSGAVTGGGAAIAGCGRHGAESRSTISFPEMAAATASGVGTTTIIWRRFAMIATLE